MATNEFDHNPGDQAANTGQLRRWILKAGRCTIGPIPILGPAARHGLRGLRFIKRRAAEVWELTRLLAERPGDEPSLIDAWRHGGPCALRDQVRRLVGIPPTEGSETDWFRQTRPGEALLSRFRRARWPAEAPRFTILTPVYNVREEWLRAAVASVVAQTYPNWEFILINDASSMPHIRPTLDELAASDSRVKVLHLASNGGVGKATNLGLERAEGDYVAFMDHDDFLEPHALHRFAEAALADGGDLIYSDEAITSEDIDDIRAIPLRSAFSYDYYLCHPYFVHFISVRTSILRRLGGIDETMTVSQDVDLGLRLIEHCRTITHVPEVLYRWRWHGASLSSRQFDRVQKATRGALERHLARIGVVAAVEDKMHHNFRDIRFKPSGAPKVAIFVTTSGGRRAELCLQSIGDTVPENLFETYVIEQPHGRSFTAPRIRGRERGDAVSQFPGSTAGLMNEIVRRLEPRFTHYLFLDSELEPINRGWLEHMLGFATRGDVGVVGALLFDPLCKIRHAGLVVGVPGTVGHPHGGANLRMGEHNRNHGRNGELLCSRDVAAVSARCMLVQAELFHDLSGFDERFLTDIHGVDLCLRTRAAGKKVVFDAHALLVDHADANNLLQYSKSDLRLLRALHKGTLEKCDKFFHPLLSANTSAFVYPPVARAREEVQFRTLEVVLPGSHHRRHIARIDHPEAHQRKRRVKMFDRHLKITAID